MQKRNKPGGGRPVKGWPPDKIKLLKKLYPVTDNETVATVLKVSVSALRNAANRFGVKKQGWTEQDIQILKDNFHLSYQKIADKIGKTKWQVRNKAVEMKLIPVKNSE
jgi:hypothetical protein